MKSLLTLVYTLLVLILVGQKTSRTSVKIIPQLSIYDIKGDTTSLEAISVGKVTFIDFWFIPCGPCFEEMNMLHKLYSKYLGNPNVSFLTITITDSSFVRPLIENRNTSSNETYNYFKKLSQLDTFKLPVYFIKGVNYKVISLRNENDKFNGQLDPSIIKADMTVYPNNVFGFEGYPTIFMFDKNGNTLYSNTGFMKKGEGRQMKRIQDIIEKNL